MLKKLFLQIFVGILGLWLADYFVSGVEFAGPLQTLFLTGAVLGLINYFIKPILKLVALPLQLLTLGFFSLVINVGIIWTLDILFAELTIKGITPLFWTTIIIWGLNLFIGRL